MYIKRKNSCRLCGNPDCRDFLDLGAQYFQGSFIKKGLPAPPKLKVPNLLMKCSTDSDKFEDACGLVQTRYSVLPELLYDNYWYRSGVSDTMKKHLASIVKSSIELIKSPEKATVLDIASNDNTLLKNYPTQYVKIGIDPSNIAKEQNDASITVINDFFPSEKLSKYKSKFDIITSIACLYDIESPLNFASNVAELLSDDGVWIFEVAYWKTMMENLSYDSIVNEHIVHYTLESIEYLLDKSGLKLISCEKTDTNGGSIICKCSHQSSDILGAQKDAQNIKKLRIEEFDADLNNPDVIENFKGRVAAHAKGLYDLIRRIRQGNHTIHLYGASTKLNTLLGYCGIATDWTPYAAERSAEKYGATTINGVQIISEKESREMKPDYYLVGPYHFKDEILAREKEYLANGGKLIFPLPEVTVYGNN